MSQGTSIEWTDATWNPTRGCSRVSEGCRNCYAERLAARMSKPGMWGHGLAKLTKAGPRWTGDVLLVPIALELPLRWKKPRRIFVNSMSDLFHESLHARDIRRILEVMIAAPQHTYQVLTKRPERMDNVIREWLEDRNRGGEVPRHIWLGVSVEDQASADERIPLLLQTPAAKRFISLEPQLAPVDLEPYLWRWDDERSDGPARPRLDWVIQGGESGPGARGFSVEWARKTRGQCAAAGVSYFLKQLGEHVHWNGGQGGGIQLWPVSMEWTEHDGAWCRRFAKKGGDQALLPADLRCREFPA